MCDSQTSGPAICGLGRLALLCQLHRCSSGPDRSIEERRPRNGVAHCPPKRMHPTRMLHLLATTIPTHRRLSHPYPLLLRHPVFGDG